MRMNRKGQALIEFIIILPVLIMLIFSFIDLGRIILENNRLEAVTTEVVVKYKETSPTAVKIEVNLITHGKYSL